MTVEQWLKIPEQDLPVKLAEALNTPKSWEHGWFDNLHVPRCSKCQCDADDRKSDKPCPVPDPIKIDWNTAKFWQGKVDPALKYYRELYMIIFEIERDLIDTEMIEKWLVRLTKPEDAKIPLIVAAMAAEGAKK